MGRRNVQEENKEMNQMLVPQKDLSSLPPRPAASPKRRFVKLVRKSSDGSEQ